MKTLISNLRGQCLFNASMKTQPDGLISLHDNKKQKTELESFLKGGEIIIESEDMLESCQKIADIIKGAQKHGKVLVAFGSGEIGPILNFVANLEGVDELYTCYGKKIIRLPILKLDLSPTRLQILRLLSKEDLKAIEIGKISGISRPMAYKHLKVLIDSGLVEKSSHTEKYTITKAGRLTIYGP
ncbi:MAG: winged helix-turn-helix domain-containing protein [Methanobacteriaceae archaeon]|nr:winged helix-turn-helix domain-containing protein [Methanobacteriaceae archaeon]